MSKVIEIATDLFAAHNPGATVTSAFLATDGDVVISYRPAGARSSAPEQTYRVWPEMIRARMAVEQYRTGDDGETVPDMALVADIVTVIERALAARGEQ